MSRNRKFGFFILLKEYSDFLVVDDLGLEIALGVGVADEDEVPVGTVFTSLALEVDDEATLRGDDVNNVTLADKRDCGDMPPEQWGARTDGLTKLLTLQVLPCLHGPLAHLEDVHGSNLEVSNVNEAAPRQRFFAD